ACGTNVDFTKEHDRLFNDLRRKVFEIIKKGNKTATTPLSEEAEQAFKIYREFLGKNGGWLIELE
ncbi:MAG: hypothetical protein AAB967_00275, partial [Patescibacteria group bacterium]